MPPPRTPKHPKAEKMLQASKTAADNVVALTEARITKLEADLVIAKQERDELAAELTAIEAL